MYTVISPATKKPDPYSYPIQIFHFGLQGTNRRRHRIGVQQGSELGTNPHT